MEPGSELVGHAAKGFKVRHVHKRRRMQPIDAPSTTKQHVLRSELWSHRARKNEQIQISPAANPM